MKKRPLSGPFFSLWSRTRDCCNSSDSCDCFDNCDSFDCFDSFDSFCAGGPILFSVGKRVSLVPF